MSLISSFKIYKGNPFPALTALFHLLSLAKGIAMFVSAFIPKLPNHERKDPAH